MMLHHLTTCIVYDVLIYADWWSQFQYSTWCENRFSIFSLKYSIKLSDWMTTPPLNTTNDRPLLKAGRLSNPTLQPPVQNEKVITLWRNIWKMINFSRCLCQLLLVYSGHEFASVWIRSGLGCISRSTLPCFQMHHYNSTTLCFSVSQWIAVVDSSFSKKDYQCYCAKYTCIQLTHSALYHSYILADGMTALLELCNCK